VERSRARFPGTQTFCAFISFPPSSYAFLSHHFHMLSRIPVMLLWQFFTCTSMKKLSGLSPRTNFDGRATTACRRS
jgi:hypothetical protein